MGDSIVFLILLQVVLIALNAIFASAEIAVLSINETKLERMAEQKDKRAKRLFQLTREPARFLATIQVAITLSGFLGSAFAAENFSEPLVELALKMGLPLPQATLETIAVVCITLILSYVTLIFGELVPKRIAMKKSEQLAMRISGLVHGISVLFQPIVWFLSISTNVVLRLCGIDPNEVEEQVTEEEIRMLVDAGSEKGAIAHQEKEFIENVFEFNDTLAGDITTHRTDVVLLWMEDDAADWAKTIYDSRHTIYPVCDGSPDNIVGVLNEKDYFRLENRTKESILEVMRPAYFVPDTIKADVLFRNLKKESTSMAIVLDEYGGMVGIITMNDLLEELVGDLGDDAPEEAAIEPHIVQLDADTWQIYGNVELIDLARALDIEIALEDVDTITGLVFYELGRIPEDGAQSLLLTFQEIAIEISRIEEHQIVEAKIKKIEQKEEETEEEA